MSVVDKLDLVEQDKQLYKAPREPEIIDVPAMQFIMVDGEGSADAIEDNPEFQAAFGALYGVAYTIKFLPKKGEAPAGYKDFKVPPPEGLWWMKGGGEFDMKRPQDWRWTLMIRMPDFVTADVVNKVIDDLVVKKKSDVYKKVRLEEYEEGQSVQIMHVGPYDAEGPTIAQMDNYATENGYKYVGKHHEIYFGDPRRTKPEKLKTLLRHPVARADS